MYYRSTFNSELFNDLSLYTYLKSTQILTLINSDINGDINNENINKDNVNIKQSIKRNIYNFKDVIEYYDLKKEFEYVGIIDKASLRKRSIDEEVPDTFKLRKKRDKILEKKRGTGIPSLTGAVCETSKKKNELFEVAKELNIKVDKLINENNSDSRVGICQLIRNRLLYLEKYSTEKEDNKFTYLIIPNNHPVYPFPLNLEDRITFIKKQISEFIPFTVNIKVEKDKNGIFEGIRDKNLVKYYIKINAKELNKFEKFILSIGFIKNNEYYILTIE
jgi:hypothetical protein